ncbi:hypothetical protein ABW20_dc0106988 [Dactylellina cionopaga]|nr:hypothetical protein ABW20_dc0106988 [Dactylellina cionopaga]
MASESNIIQHNTTDILQTLQTIRLHLLTLAPKDLFVHGLVSLSAFAAAYAFIYVPIRFIYRVYFDPYSKIPGPKLHLVSDFLTRLSWTASGRRGYYHFKLKEWHDQYGPIIRTGSNFVHVDDIDAYNQVFKVGTKFPKSAIFYNHPSTEDSVLNISDFHEAHLRRGALQPYFSKQAVRKLEGLIQSKVTKFLDRLSSMDVIDVSRGFRCLACDVITTYSYEQCFEALEEPNFAPAWLRAFESLIESTAIQEALPTIFKFAAWFFEKFLSRDTVRKIAPEMAQVLDFSDICASAVMAQKKRWAAGETGIVTIFEQLFQDDPKKGRKAATDQQLGADALLTVSAGMDTTGHTLTMATYYLVKNPEMQKRLLNELKTVMPYPRSEVEEETLEQLPVLQACLKESLRFGHGIPGPLPRDVPPNGATVVGHYIPPGGMVMHSHYTYHTNATVFPDPLRWDPTRWLAADTKEIEKYLMPFSRGARICIGMNLAWAELSLTVARLMRRFEVSFAEGFKDEDILEWRSMFVPVTKGPLKITVKEREE